LRAVAVNLLGNGFLLARNGLGLGTRCLGRGGAGLGGRVGGGVEVGVAGDVLLFPGVEAVLDGFGGAF